MPKLLGLSVRCRLQFLFVRRSTRRGCTTFPYALEEGMQVSAPALAREVGIVRWGSERYGFSSTSEHIGDRVGEGLELVRPKPDLIVDDIIMSGTNCALKTVVRLKEEIKFINRRDTPIHYSSRPRVSILVRVLCISGEEPCVVSLSTDDDRQLRSIRLFGISKSFECFPDFWQLLLNNKIELPLRDTIPVDDDSARQRLLLALVEPQAFFHHGFQIGYHLLFRLLHSQTCRELCKVFVDCGNHSGDRWSSPDGAGTRVGYIHTDQHGRLRGIPQPSERRGRSRGVDQLVIDTAHLHVDLQGNIPEVLQLAFFLPEFGHLDADAGDLEIYVKKMFETVVDVFVAVGKNDQNHGGFFLGIAE